MPYTMGGRDAEQVRVQPPALVVTEPLTESPEADHPVLSGARELRAYTEQQRGQTLIRVRPGLWMFGSGN